MRALALIFVDALHRLFYSERYKFSGHRLHKKNLPPPLKKQTKQAKTFGKRRNEDEKVKEEKERKRREEKEERNRPRRQQQKITQKVTKKQNKTEQSNLTKKTDPVYYY